MDELLHSEFETQSFRSVEVLTAGGKLIFPAPDILQFECYSDHIWVNMRDQSVTIIAMNHVIAVEYVRSAP